MLLKKGRVVEMKVVKVIYEDCSRKCGIKLCIEYLFFFMLEVWFLKILNVGCEYIFIYYFIYIILLMLSYGNYR